MAIKNPDNLSSTMGNDNPGKGSGKRKRRRFKVSGRKRGYPEVIFANTYHLTDYVATLPQHQKATTARNNDGMSFVW